MAPTADAACTSRAGLWRDASCREAASVAEDAPLSETLDSELGTPGSTSSELAVETTRMGCRLCLQLAQPGFIAANPRNGSCQYSLRHASQGQQGSDSVSDRSTRARRQIAGSTSKPDAACSTSSAPAGKLMHANEEKKREKAEGEIRGEVQGWGGGGFVQQPGLLARPGGTPRPGRSRGRCDFRCLGALSADPESWSSGSLVVVKSTRTPGAPKVSGCEVRNKRFLVAESGLPE